MAGAYGALAGPWTATPAQAADRTVALVGDLQSELGCSADWQPECAATDLLPTGTEGQYAAEFGVPAGTWQYKVAINDAWDEAYGRDGGGDNIPLVLAGQTRLTFRRCGITDPLSLDDYRAHGGLKGLERAAAMPPEAVSQPSSRSAPTRSSAPTASAA